jgi:hypothetical protein
MDCIHFNISQLLFISTFFRVVAEVLPTSETIHNTHTQKKKKELNIVKHFIHMIDYTFRIFNT